MSLPQRPSIDVRSGWILRLLGSVVSPARLRTVKETYIAMREKITDGALLPGEELLKAPSDEEVARVAEKLGAPKPKEAL